MKRQFLRVYLGLALVLLGAAFAVLFVVNRELRTFADQRLTVALTPWVAAMQRRFNSVVDDPWHLAAMLDRLNESAPFHARLIQPDQVELSTEDGQRLAAGEPILLHTVEGRLLYAAFDGGLIVLGPLGEDALRRAGAPSPGRGPRGRLRAALHKPPPLPWGLPPQGAYFLLAVLLALLVLIGFAVYWLLRPFERRIYALADVAHTLGAGELDSRAAPQAQDAIGELARAFNNMADRLSGLIEGQRELLRAVSHEFRTPLARLFFLVDDAREKSDPVEKNRLLGRVEGSLQDLDDLVEELLTFVRLEGDAVPRRESVDFNGLVASMGEVVADLRPDLELDIEGAPATVSGVPHLLRRAVLNLVTNGVRHAHSRLQLSLTVDMDRICLLVDDDGPGIAPQDRDKIFAPFTRLDQSRTSQSGGVGLGLAIAHRIAAVHQGSLNTADSPLGGARFILALPVQDNNSI